MKRLYVFIAEKEQPGLSVQVELAMTSKRLCLTSLLVLCLAMTSWGSDVKVGVILPPRGQQPWIMPRASPAVQLALEAVERMGLLPGKRMLWAGGESNCSGVRAPLSATDLHTRQQANVFVGPACSLSLAPVARYAQYSNIPLLTVGGLAGEFGDKSEYPLLTRMSGSYEKGAEFVVTLMRVFAWTKASLVYDTEYQSYDGGMGSGTCSMSMRAVRKALQEAFGSSPGFNEFQEADPDTDYQQILRDASGNSAVIVVCASPSAVRDLMIQAHDLGLHNGDFVFITLDFMDSLMTSRPWYSDVDSEERNTKAREAFESVMALTLRKPGSFEYRMFSRLVKQHTDRTLVSVGEEEVGPFVAASHDAVVLYALALNETLEAGGDVTDGVSVTRRMWNRTFQGVSGTVSMDENGDRNADYTVWDLNPATAAFEVMANYYGSKKQYEPVTGKRIHWGGGRSEPPPDLPPCGFNPSQCSSGGADTEADTENGMM